MSNSLSLLSFITLLIAILIAGCAKDDTVGPSTDQPPSGVTNEQQAIQYYATVDQFVENDEQTFNDNTLQPSDYEMIGSMKVSADITPLRFGRFVTSVRRSVTVTVLPGDTIAKALVTKNITGIFKIVGITLSGDTSLFEKPFNDQALRIVIFRRIAHDALRYWRNWFPIASSLVKGGTVAPNDNIQISKVEMFLPNGDTVVVTDPNDYFLRYRWSNCRFRDCRRDVPELIAGQQVRTRVTVVSKSSDTDMVALRWGCDATHKRRARFVIVSEVNNGDGTYTREFEIRWRVHPHHGFFHAGIDAATHETVHDDVAPYSVSWWGVPYRVSAQ